MTYDDLSSSSPFLHYLAPGTDRDSHLFFIYFFWLTATRPKYVFSGLVCITFRPIYIWITGTIANPPVFPNSDREHSRQISHFRDPRLT